VSVELYYRKILPPLLPLDIKDNFHLNNLVRSELENQILKIDTKFKDCIHKDMEIQEIANQMKIVDSTVRNYITSLYEQRSIQKTRKLEKQAREM